MRDFRVLLAAFLAGILVFGLTFYALRQFEYNRIESLTTKHGEEFVQLIKRIAESGGSEEAVEYFKVFSYGRSRAKLFVVTRVEEGHRVGCFYYLAKDDWQWNVVRIKLVWASHGSADEATWPPYR